MFGQDEKHLFVRRQPRADTVEAQPFRHPRRNLGPVSRGQEDARNPLPPQAGKHLGCPFAEGVGHDQMPRQTAFDGHGHHDRPCRQFRVITRQTAHAPRDETIAPDDDLPSVDETDDAFARDFSHIFGDG